MVNWKMTGKNIRTTNIVFLWNNFGPYHMDRVEAVQRYFGPSTKVLGVELFPSSTTYAWKTRPTDLFEKRTVFAPGERPSFITTVRRVLAHMPLPQKTCTFLCHYENPAIFSLAIIIRLRGGRVFTMNNSKFDDKPRFVFKESAKSLFLVPYHGALSNGNRSRAYWAFLGFRRRPVAGEYNTVSLDRIRRQAGVSPAPSGTPFLDRHFTCIARLIPEKNIASLLTAYRQYCDRADAPRQLQLCGSGPLETELRQQADELGISDRTIFRGWVQDDEICRTLGSTLALLLPSVSETFGNVVIEAQAMGLPVILSERCGARDLLIRSGVNGFIVEPENPEGWAFFMALLSNDEALWRHMCDATNTRAPMGDVRQFVAGVSTLVQRREVRKSVLQAKATGM